MPELGELEEERQNLAAPRVSLDSVLGVFRSVEEKGTWHSFECLAYQSGLCLNKDENNKAPYCHHLPGS